MSARRTREVRRQLGENVRRVRLAQGRTQAELGAMAGVEHRTVQRVEAGATASLGTIVAIADALEVPLSKLFHPVQTIKVRRPGRPAGR